MGQRSRPEQIICMPYLNCESEPASEMILPGLGATTRVVEAHGHDLLE